MLEYNNPVPIREKKKPIENPTTRLWRFPADRAFSSAESSNYKNENSEEKKNV
jgi:hypothetical protein